MWRRQTGRLCRLSFDGEHMTAHTGQNNGSNRKTFLLLLPLLCPVFVRVIFRYSAVSIPLFLLEKLPVLLSYSSCAAIRRPVSFPYPFSSGCL